MLTIYIWFHRQLYQFQYILWTGPQVVKIIDVYDGFASTNHKKLEIFICERL